MASILDFQTALEESARPDQFKVTINFPLLVENSTEATRRSTTLTYTGSIPSCTVQDIEVYYRGRQYHEAGEKQYQPWTCQIYNDVKFVVRGALESWSNLIRAPQSTDGAMLPADYKSTITIEQLDRSGETTRMYTLVGAYPTEIGEISLDYGNGNQLEMYNVNFVFDYFIAG